MERARVVHEHRLGLWYRFTASTTGTYVLDATASNFPVGLAAFSPIASPLTEIACNADEGTPVMLEVAARAGDDVFILAGGQNFDSGQLRLDLIDL